MQGDESKKIHGSQVVVSLITVYIAYKMIYNNVYYNYNYVIIMYKNNYIQSIYIYAYTHKNTVLHGLSIYSINIS